MFSGDSKSRLGRRGRYVYVLVATFVIAAAASDIAVAADQPGESLASLPQELADSTQSIPEVLSAQDEARYREIFALQEKGHWNKADKLIAQLEDDRLMGHVLEQRYMHPKAYRSKYVELKRWLDSYADHPQAGRVYKLAKKRRPANYKYPRKPQGKALSGVAPRTYKYESPKKRTVTERRRVRQIKRQIRRNVLRTRLTVTEKLLRSAEVKRLFDQVEIDEGLSKVAAAWFYYGKTERAYELSATAAARSGDHVADAHWIAGLAAWRLGRTADAATHFEALALSERSSEWLVTAGAYWASRANLRLRKPAEVSRWLRIAADHRFTFYGLLASAALGRDTGLDFSRLEIGPDELRRIEARPAGRRALALLQVGQPRRAERELLRFGTLDDDGDIRALLILADKAGLPNLAFRVGNRIFYGSDESNDDPAVAAALYPLPPWQPRSGFNLDRALIYALMRQESAFKPTAKSRDGARGLMQLMPRTASFIAPGSGYHKRSKRNALYDPALNLELGQRYIAHLLEQDIVEGDLFRMAAAYNGGPGNLQKWQRHVKAEHDPLLFIESLPSRETRLFIERVLANLWIYRQRLGQNAPSLEQAAAGQWPRYQSLDLARPEVAAHAQN